ncbi:MAG: TPM domain-containing protein [Pseudomonadota bacterium]
MKRLFLALTLLLWPLVAAAQLYPDPDRSTINDFAQVLTAAQRTDLHRQLAALREETGVHLTVVTLSRQAPIAPDMEFEAFATGLFNHWGVGDRTRNDGIMFLVLTEDRRIRIELGAGYDRAWDRVAKGIITEAITPPLAQNDWITGINAGVREIGAQIARPFAADETPPVDTTGRWVMGVIAGFFALWFGGGWIRNRLRKCPQCGTRGSLRTSTVTLEQATRHSSGRSEVTTTCENCGYNNVAFRTIPRITRSSSGSSGFGGGSSSGGGASGRF